MKRWSLGAIALSAILVTGYNLWPNKAEFVSADRFLRECGYELPQTGSEVTVHFAQDGVLKLHPEVTKVVATGYEKESGGQTYVKVENPFSSRFAPFLEVKCQRLEP